MLENKVAEIEGALGTGLAVAPGTEGAYVVVDRAVLPGHVGLMFGEGGVGLGRLFAHPVVLVGAGCRAFAAGSGVVSGPADHSTVPGSEAHNLLVPVVHRIPSEQRINTILRLRTQLDR